MSWHGFEIADANKYGVEGAVMLTNLVFWIAKNKANEKHEHDGRTWTYNSAKAFAKLFPYWSEKQVRRILDSLIKDGAIVTGSFNESSYIHTRWFALVDESRLSGHIDLPKRANRSSQTGTSLTDSKPNGKTHEGEEVFLDLGIETRNEKLIASLLRQSHIETLWNLYPKKTGDKKAALRLIGNKLRKHSFEALKKGIEDYIASKTGVEEKFIASPYNWFSADRFLESPANGTFQKPKATLRQSVTSRQAQ